MGNSNISWTNKSWNPITGCSKVSQGCAHCYAEREWPRLQHSPLYAGRKFTDVAFHESRIREPLKWRNPCLVFVNSLSDLFHPSVTDEQLDRVFAVMALCPQHTFQILTKRPERMREYCAALANGKRFLGGALSSIGQDGFFSKMAVAGALGVFGSGGKPPYRPLPNVWLGVSVEDQDSADQRIPLLLETPAAVRWISAEPLLEEIIVENSLLPSSNSPTLDWVVCGAESGPKARWMSDDWALSLIRQCLDTGTPFFMKQLSSSHGRSRVIRDVGLFPQDLRIQEYPIPPAGNVPAHPHTSSAGHNPTSRTDHACSPQNQDGAEPPAPPPTGCCMGSGEDGEAESV